MLKCEVNHDRGSNATVAIEACGSLADQILDTILVVNAVYSSLSKHNADAAEKFKMILMLELLDPSGQAWKMAESQRGTITSITIPKGGKTDD